ncbi:Protein trichome birefringence-like 37 [Linum grandiflorum]
MSVEKSSKLHFRLLMIVLTVCLACLGGANGTCDIFSGEWVSDDSYSSANDYSSSCPFISAEFDCEKYGRPDRQYLKYRWQPSRCDLPRSDRLLHFVAVDESESQINHR